MNGETQNNLVAKVKSNSFREIYLKSFIGLVLVISVIEILSIIAGVSSLLQTRIVASLVVVAFYGGISNGILALIEKSKKEVFKYSMLAVFWSSLVLSIFKIFTALNHSLSEFTDQVIREDYQNYFTQDYESVGIPFAFFVWFILSSLVVIAFFSVLVVFALYLVYLVVPRNKVAVYGNNCLVVFLLLFYVVNTFKFILNDAGVKNLELLNRAQFSLVVAGAAALFVLTLGNRLPLDLKYVDLKFVITPTNFAIGLFSAIFLLKPDPLKMDDLFYGAIANNFVFFKKEAKKQKLIVEISNFNDIDTLKANDEFNLAIRKFFENGQLELVNGEGGQNSQLVNVNISEAKSIMKNLPGDERLWLLFAEGVIRLIENPIDSKQFNSKQFNSNQFNQN